MDSMSITIDLVWLQSRAERLRTYEAMLVPGLLQTREYAESEVSHFLGPRDGLT